MPFLATAQGVVGGDLLVSQSCRRNSSMKRLDYIIFIAQSKWVIQCRLQNTLPGLECAQESRVWQRSGLYSSWIQLCLQLNQSLPTLQSFALDLGNSWESKVVSDAALASPSPTPITCRSHSTMIWNLFAGFLCPHQYSTWHTSLCLWGLLATTTVMALTAATSFTNLNSFFNPAFCFLGFFFSTW